MSNQSVALEQFIGGVGHFCDIAWWDMFPAAAELKLFADLQPEQFAPCDVLNLPAELLQDHQAIRRRVVAEGLELEAEPFAIGVFRYADGRLGVLAGYRKPIAA